MNKITLRDLIELYNFREYGGDISEYKKCDTKIIRIYLGCSVDNRYVEFGIYDFGPDYEKKYLCENFIRPDVLDREISYLEYDHELNVFCIHLEGDVIE